ncbi:MAG TPA: exodeoxyribonuclease VII large subunit [Candidatus Thermoplasmatota archaeon]|nr:exodeoxyribonuclease VII large subunit [Candidatus Thermoplasmatota archaeon]
MAPSRKVSRLPVEFEEPAASAPAAVAEGPKGVGVTEAVRLITDTLRKNPALSDMWVRGEVGDFTAARSGHWYFTLKDATSAIACVMWSTANARVRFPVKTGMKLLVRASVAVYQDQGKLQLKVEELVAEGIGDLAARFEELKRRLDAEGLFRGDRKRTLPEFPLVVGVVTSGSGAVWHDIRKVARRRWPGVSLLLAPVRVQGDGAAEEIADAIARMNAAGRADVLIVGRGGGSLEDLWAFNEEVVVRAVVASRIPVVSAVGHETDFTLCDFAADLRAPTPSAAAETCVPDIVTVIASVEAAEERLRQALANAAERARQRLDEAETSLAKAARRVVERGRAAVAERAASLDALSPLATLARGYAVAIGPDGRALRDAAAVREGDAVSVRLARGRLTARVERKEDSQ